MFLIANLRHNIKFIGFLGIHAGILLMSVGCSQENPSALPPEEDVILTVSAGISREIYSRDENETTTVTSGTYYLSYPIASDESYSLGEVVFGSDSANPQIGFVSTPGDEPFKWLQVGGSNPVFYLDNVSPELSTDQNNVTLVEFNEENPFIAGLYNPANPSNDLLWGTTTVQKNTTGTINFDLHHNMSRVQVQITADRTYDTDGQLDLEGAKVWISNINLAPKTFDRLTGLLTLVYDYPESYGDIILVNESTSVEEELISWAGTWPNDNGFPTYLSQSCILPPQELLDNENRPRLTIQLKNGTRFSGVLPHAMEIDPPGSTESQNPYPVTLSFLKEHVLTIRTVISADPPELAFMPVTVVEWVDKGEFDLEAHQAGIYTAAEFKKMIEYYQARNTYQLQRYGWFSEEESQWNFNIFNTLLLQVNNIDELYGKMKPEVTKSAGYTFNFNNYSVYIRVGTADPKSVTADQLRDILSGISKLPF